MLEAQLSLKLKHLVRSTQSTQARGECPCASLRESLKSAGGVSARRASYKTRRKEKREKSSLDPFLPKRSPPSLTRARVVRSRRGCWNCAAS